MKLNQVWDVIPSQLSKENKKPMQFPVQVDWDENKLTEFLNDYETFIGKNFFGVLDKRQFITNWLKQQPVFNH